MAPSVGLLVTVPYGAFSQGGGAALAKTPPSQSKPPSFRYSFSDQYPLPVSKARSRATSVSASFAKGGKTSTPAEPVWNPPAESQMWWGENEGFPQMGGSEQAQEERVLSPQRLRRAQSLPNENPIRRLIREESLSNKDAFVDPLPEGMPVLMRHKARSYTVGSSNRVASEAPIVRAQSLPARLLKPQVNLISSSFWKMLTSLKEEEAFIERETVAGEQWPAEEGHTLARTKSWVPGAPLPGFPAAPQPGPVANSSRRPSYIFRSENRRSSLSNGADLAAGQVAASQPSGRMSFTYGEAVPRGRRRLSAATSKRSSLSQSVAQNETLHGLENRVSDNGNGLGATTMRRASSIGRRSSLSVAGPRPRDPSELLQSLSEQERRTVALLSAAIGLQLTSAIAGVLAMATVSASGARAVMFE
ncbi:hypothetical protein KFL_003200090 [Klebsormidium nitens]|uniref:Uncharacterized protein n=1 Tax=Klebsormidium nitens TaxID=105231 RepID=A0A1Y1IDW4_KLENI|nr:hypothetical protein KFL_003200090 [Klebsormidium nitens]|eukprot:GAQ86917.1 hypothetical protein KFL_003200090 [Klebsormidium nitens]